MENIYLFLLIVLFILAIGDLIVGVSNDAVNFLNPAIGSKVISFKNIMIFASIGIALGAVSSSGMMEVARKGIFNPSSFYFDEIIFIFMAVMITDILLLDFFNSLGLPTSTTVSIVFELLGASVVMALIKINNSTKDFSELSNYINNEKAIQIVLGILLSVFIAFTIGGLVQWISRFILSYKLDKLKPEINSIFGGIAIASIFNFILIKGIKGSPFAEVKFALLNNSDVSSFIDENNLIVSVLNFIIWYFFSYVVIRFFKIDIYKIIIGIGTFALALAFAGNDLVNFIGVPVAAFQSYEAWSNSGLAASEFEMGFLSNKVAAPTFLLLGSGIIMVLTLWFSSKAKRVVKTSLDLSSQYETKERFKSNALSRSLVSFGIFLNNIVRKILPKSIKKSIKKSFKIPKDSKIYVSIINRPSFDKLRASINLVVAAVLISFATSFKLPLSTTYVTFMVTMGTSLADRAWGTDSAVYRVSGVLNVILGWFFTAIVAFTVGGIIVFTIFQGGFYALLIILLFVLIIVGKSYYNSTKQSKIIFEENKLLITNASTYEEVIIQSGANIARVAKRINNIFDILIDGLAKNEVKLIKKGLKNINKLEIEVDELRENIFFFIKNLKKSSVSASKFYIKLLDEVEDLTKDLKNILNKSFNHIINNHKKLKLNQIRNLLLVQNFVNQNLLNKINKSFKKNSNIEEFEEILISKDRVIDMINKKIEDQIIASKDEESRLRNSKLYFNVLLRTKDIATSNYNIVEHYYNVVKKLKEVVI
tara:strand:+ start:3898 stop:6186 length:2289 start_codon:yes stop_codon:yes gene_type:complete